MRSGASPAATTAGVQILRRKLSGSMWSRSGDVNTKPSRPRPAQCRRCSRLSTTTADSAIARTLERVFSGWRPVAVVVASELLDNPQVAMEQVDTVAAQAGHLAETQSAVGADKDERPVGHVDGRGELGDVAGSE